MAGAIREVALIGRRAEHDVIVQALERACAGDPWFVAVGGEAGIGKTRLVRAALATFASTRPDGVSVHPGTCSPGGAGPAPSAPFGAIARSLIRSLDVSRLDRLLGWARLPLEPLVPELAIRGSAPGIGWPRHDQGSGEGPDGAERTAQAIRTLIEVTARTVGPVAIVLEDLHWAGPSALALLAWLVHEIDHAPVAFLATHRTGGGDDGQALEMLAELGRLDHVGRVALEPLSDPDAMALLKAIAPDDVPLATIAHLVQRAGGIPLYLEELAADTDRAMGPPASVRIGVARRMARLDPPAAQVVRLAGVVGAPVDWRLLGVAAGQDLAMSINAVRAAVDAGLLTSEASGTTRIQVRHVLVAEAISAGLVPGETAVLAADLARTLDRLPEYGPDDAGDRAALMASLWLAADRPRSAEPALREVARLALARGAFEEAHLAFERILTLRRDPSVAIDPVLRRLEEDTARAAWLAGHPDRALELGQRVIDAAAEGSPADLHRSLVRQARYARASGDPRASLDLLRPVLREAAAADIRCRAFMECGRASLALGRTPAAIDAFRVALDESRTARDPRSTEHAAAALGAALSGAGRHREALEAFDQVRIAGSQGAGPADPSPSSLPEAVQRTIDEVAFRRSIGDRPGTLASALRARADASRLGLDPVFGGVATALAALELLRAGRWEEAWQLLPVHSASNEDAEVAAATFATPVDVVAALLAVRRGEPAAVGRLARLLPGRLSVVGGVDWRMLLEQARCEQAKAARRWPEAREALERGLAGEARDVGSTGLVELLCLGVAVEADRIWWLRHRGGRAGPSDGVERASGWLGWLRSILEQETPDDASPGPWSIAIEARAAAEETRWTGPDEVAWERAAEQAHRALGPFDEATACVAWAIAALELGRDRAMVAGLLRRAEVLADGLGARPVLDAIGQVRRRARIDVDRASNRPGGAPDSPRDRARSRGLSGREVDVLSLLAQGRSDREIADALFISERTASHHVSHILAKLGVARRGEASAEAHRLGIHLLTDLEG